MLLDFLLLQYLYHNQHGKTCDYCLFFCHIETHLLITDKNLNFIAEKWVDLFSFLIEMVLFDFL